MNKYNVLIDDIEANHEAFVALHGQSDHYGGSSVANICGLGFDSPLKEWLRRTGKVAPVEQTNQMKLGQYMEPFLAELLEDKIQLPVMQINQVWQHKDVPWMVASPDAWTGTAEGGKELVEFKTHKAYADKFWDSEQASDSAMCQLQWYLAVSGFKGGYCCALIGGDTDKFYTPYFESDKEVQGQLIEQVERFRELVQADTPPDAGPGDAELIKEHLTKDVDKEKELDLSKSGKHAGLIAYYRDLIEQKEKLKPVWDDVEKGIKSIQNQFLADSNGAGIITVGNDRIKLTEVAPTTYTTTRKGYYKVTVKLED